MRSACASHDFISFEAWQTLPKGSMVPTNAIVRAITGTRTKPIGHVTLDIIIATRVAGTLLCIAYRYNGRACGPWIYVVLFDKLSN